MKRSILGATLLVAGVVACKKENSNTNSTDVQTAAAQVQAVAVARSSSTSEDSIYAIHSCERSETRAQIDFSALPASASTYLSTNYGGYTTVKAFSISNTSGTVTGYLAIIQFNNEYVAVKFDAAGNFVKVLELREGRDLLGEGWHRGGCFENRDRGHRDTIDLNTLPAAIIAYMTTNYAGDTLVAAFLRHGGEVVVISRNGDLFATVFSSTGVYITRVQLPAHHDRITPLAESALPASVTAYLSATYSGYVFDRAFSYSWNGTLQGYWVIIDCNNTKYAVQFDSSGNFVRARVIR